MASDLEVEQSEGNSPTQQISVKCRAKRLFKLISTLNDAQRFAVKRIGFGGLLELKFKNFPISSLRFFLDCFSDGSYVCRAPHSKEFMLSKYDVHDCFLLPLGPNELDLVPTGQQKGSNSEENRELKERWRQRFRIESAKGSIPLGKINAAIEADREGGDDFCTLWVLMCMSSFLAPTSNNGVDFKLLRAAENVNDLPKMDWCSYVIDSLVTAGVESKNKHTHILGCLPFLMISYFQRFDYRGQISVCELPLIKHWDEARLKSRTKGEIGDGGLGRQAWSFVKYPRCIHRSTNLHVNIFGDNFLPTSATPKLDGGKKVIPLEIPQDVEDDIELKARALDADMVAMDTDVDLSKTDLKSAEASGSRTPQPATKSEYANQGIEDVRLYDDNVLDDGLIGSGSFYNTAEINEVMLGDEKVSHIPLVEEEPNNPTQGILRSILEEAGYTASEVDATYQLLQKRRASGPDVEAGDIDVQEIGRTSGGEDGQAGGSVGPESSDHPFNLQSKLPLSWTGDGTCKRRRTSTPDRVTPDAGSENHPSDEQLSAVSSRRRGRGDGLGCSLDCGQATGASLLVVSNFLRNNMSLFRNVKDWRKHVADYCFLDDGGMSQVEEIVAYGHNAKLQRSDVLSLLPDRLTSPAAIECWAFLLNRIESEENEKQRMAFFGLRHTDVLTSLMETPTQCTPSDDHYDMLYKQWDAYVKECGRTINLDSELIFIPIMTNNHMACVCVNFKSKTADIFDLIIEPIV
ncbi:hypothetical protein RND81_04G137000 [Saponaria officinalis]|uniref:Ubiquitin-like protease family profile domain-containing protein n=1 Tax=Saponaria officinalis TaxID=3572 RepID=A0AAW1LLF6_SAPOF